MTAPLTFPNLADLGAEINEQHTLAIQHASKALEHAFTCGELLIEAKSKARHGQWLPWLRENISFSERTCQSYMRLVQRKRQIRSSAADLSVRGALQHLSTPRRYDRATLDEEVTEWLAQLAEITATRPDNVSEWSIEDAQACIDSIRGIDSILHRYGICSEEDCLVCDGEGSE